MAADGYVYMFLAARTGWTGRDGVDALGDGLSCRGPCLNNRDGGGALV